jgi:hypothetical protein
MPENEKTGGYLRIYQDLLQELAKADLDWSARRLGLHQNRSGEIEIPCLGKIYWLSNSGLRHPEEASFPAPLGSVLIHYVLRGNQGEPADQFVKLEDLAGPVFKNNYSQGALEFPLIKRFKGKVLELLAVADSLGGRRDGESGLGSVSLVFDLLPKIPIQLIFYDQDAEFPARVTLLYDRNATLFIEFEYLAVLATQFVQALLKKPEDLVRK